MAEEVDRAMEAYPRAKARTLRFTLGAPRSALAVGTAHGLSFYAPTGLRTW